MRDQIDNQIPSAVIKVAGIGGGGCEAVKHMIARKFEGVEFICVNTDAQALKKSSSCVVLQLGSRATKGLGAGANPELGRQAALEDRDIIAKSLDGADMIFITAGLGGGTGTGSAPVVAKVAKELGILTVAVVTTPFPFEGRKRMEVAEQGVIELKKYVDSIIVIPNEKILGTLSDNASLLEAFNAANEAVLRAVQGIADLITRPGLINVDLADVRAVMTDMGMATLGRGVASGKDRARMATKEAIASPLLKDIRLATARGIIVNITGGLDMSIGEFEEVGNTIKEAASENATIVVGTVIDTDMLDDGLSVTVVATGLRNNDAASQSHTHGRRKPQSETPGNLDYLDIPAFFRRTTDKADRETGVKIVRLVAPEATSDAELAELIVHLSNVYKSIGGDELVIDNVATLPPDSATIYIKTHQKKLRASR